jgi:hypothetical protein
VSTHETLGLLLVREGLITRTELYDALRLQRQNNRLLGTCLLSLGTVRPEVLLEMLARQLGIPALPPGTLKRAQPAAIARVPAELAWRLRILPYSWDGEMLGVAVTDGRVLEHLQEVAYHARCAVGAYVALELEIEEVLRGMYRELEVPAATPALEGRPRPPRAEASPALEAPTVLSKVKEPTPPPSPPAALPPKPSVASGGAPRAREATPAFGVPIINKAPPPASSVDVAIVRVSFFDAVEQIYAATSPAGIARLCGQALLNYFTRVAVAVHMAGAYRLVACAGTAPRRIDVPETALPLLTRRMGERNISYGPAGLDVRAAEVCGVFGLEGGATSLLVAVGAMTGPERLFLYADNGDSRELYEDLHDIELLCKEAETAMGMLRDKR